MNIFHIRFNAVVRRFVLADLIWLGGWGLMSPIFGVFVVDKIPGGTVLTVGIGAAIYWVLKSVIQIPVALAIDRTPSERDDYLILVVSLMLAGCTAFSFILVKTVWQLYLVQAMQAVSFALYIPSWNGIFTRHLDPEHRALEFALDSAAVGVATGLAGLVGSIIADTFGFSVIFFMTAILSFVSAIIIFYSPSIIFPRHRQGGSISSGDHTPRNLER